MNDAIPEPADAVKETLEALERRVRVLESKVEALPDQRQIEEHVAERVKASMPPPIDPAHAPSFRDITLPIPNVDTIVTTAKTTWALIEMFSEMKALLWMLVDRRYHMGWVTRVLAIVLLVAILCSPWWVPFGGYDNIISRLVDKAADLVLGLVLFMILIYETRRYKDWRGQR
jgi:hypothetical protein